MNTFRLTFRGTGFADASDPTGQQMVEGFSVTLHQHGASEADAVAAGKTALLADPKMQAMIRATREALGQEMTWSIDCVKAVELGLWSRLASQPKNELVYHWSKPTTAQ